MNLSLKVAAAYLESKGLKFSISDDGNAIRIGTSLKNKESIEVLLVFEGSALAVRSFGYCKFTEAKKPAMYELCSKMNNLYRWVKFYVQEDDNTVTLADDAVIQPETCGEEVLELFLRMASIADEVYPEFMKRIWA